MSENTDYAIVRTGGKQYRVAIGDRVRVDKLSQQPGNPVDLDEVLLLAKGGKVSVGTPVVRGAKVKATVAEHGREAKITVFKYKSKVRYRRKTGHRQPYTDLTIEGITAGRSKARTAPKPKKSKVSEDE